MAETIDIDNLPSRFSGALFRWLLNQGYDAKAILKDTQINEVKLLHSSANLTLKQHIQLVQNAMSIYKDEGLSFTFGHALGIKALGLVGHTIMNCGKVHEALTLVLHFFKLFSPLLKVSFELRSNQNAIIHLIDHQNCKSIHRFRIECFSAITLSVLRTLTHKHLPILTVEAKYSRPNTWKNSLALYHGLFFQFNSDTEGIVFPANILDLSLPSYDPFWLTQMTDVCQNLQNESDQSITLLSRLKTIIDQHLDRTFNLGDCAVLLGLSSRTLRRELHKLGSSFQAVVNKQKTDRAMTLLQNQRTSIEQIASAVGYQDASSFTRAFKRWTGYPPSHFRCRQSIKIES